MSRFGSTSTESPITSGQVAPIPTPTPDPALGVGTETVATSGAVELLDGTPAPIPREEVDPVIGASASPDTAETTGGLEGFAAVDNVQKTGNDMSGLFHEIQKHNLAQAEPTQVHTGVTSSLPGSMLAALEALKNPMEAITNAATGAPATQDELPGYHTTNAGYIKGENGAQILGARVGGRFYYPQDKLDPKMLKTLDAMVARGFATHVTDKSTE